MEQQKEAYLERERSRDAKRVKVENKEERRRERLEAYERRERDRARVGSVKPHLGENGNVPKERPLHQPEETMEGSIGKSDAVRVEAVPGEVVDLTELSD
jgi:hypothetical protein